MKLSEEVLAGPSFEEPPSGAFAEEERVARAGEEDIPAGRGNRRAEVPRSIGRAAGNRGRAREHRDGCLRHGIFSAPRAEILRGARASDRRHGRRRAGFIYDAMDRIEKEARTALAAVAEGDALTTQLAVLRRFAKHAPSTRSPSGGVWRMPCSRRIATRSKAADAPMPPFRLGLRFKPFREANDFSILLLD